MSPALSIRHPPSSPCLWLAARRILRLLAANHRKCFSKRNLHVTPTFPNLIKLFYCDAKSHKERSAPAATESGLAPGRTRTDADMDKCPEQEKAEQTGCFLCCSALLFKNSSSVSIGVDLWPIKINQGKSR
jgi:hypothetical protein